MSLISYCGYCGTELLERRDVNGKILYWMCPECESACRDRFMNELCDICANTCVWGCRCRGFVPLNPNHSDILEDEDG